jgi:hypothetical protein
LEVTERIADKLFEVSYEYGLKVKKLYGKTKSSVSEIKIPVFRQF